MPGTISRRAAVGLVGAGGLATALVGKLGSAPAADGGTASLGSLAVGSRFARWTVAAVHPIANGGLSVDVIDGEGHPFTLEVLARDTSLLAPAPPAAVGELAIYVCNGGDGWLPTVEEQGLAAMTLASVIEAAGGGQRAEGLLTHAERLVAHRGTLLEHVPAIV